MVSKLLEASETAAIPFRQRRALWVVPDAEEHRRLEALLKERGFDTDLHQFYEAPFYDDARGFDDEVLLAAIEAHRADWVVIGISGGRQEKVGIFLRDRLRPGRLPAIVCSGAAAAFISGGQVRVPEWADRTYLGWLFRILDNPSRFTRRYVDALRLPAVVRRLSARTAARPESRER